MIVSPLKKWELFRLTRKAQDVGLALENEAVVAIFTETKSNIQAVCTTSEACRRLF